MCSEIKYLLGENNELFVSRVLQNKQWYPFNYGYFPNTIEEDGDPLDVFVQGPILHPRTNIAVSIVGAIEVIDDRGRDTKILAVVPDREAYYTPQQMDAAIRSFLMKYKYAHEKVEIGRSLSREEAILIYHRATLGINEHKMLNLMDTFI